MPKDSLLELEGTIKDAMGGGQYQIEIPSSNRGQPPTTVRAMLSGRLKKNHIRVLPGDIVTVGVSPYDLTHGIITYRGRKRHQDE